MNQTYTLLLTVLFKHQYFADGLFKPIEISFAEGSGKRIKDLGIVIKPFGGGLHLLASDFDLLYSLNDEEPIRLYLNCRESIYINYTELPMYRPSDTLLYFNNLSKLSGSQNNSFFLHNNEFVGQEEVAQLTNGKISIPEFNAAKEYRFFDVKGNELYSDNVTQNVQNSDSFTLLNLQEGLVRIYDDNEEVERFFYSPQRFWQNPFGVVDIYPGQLFSEYAENGKVDYAINFNNRKTIWKYFLVGPVYQKFNNLSIITKGKEQVFYAPQKQLVQNNTEAQVFESKNKIPLSEFSDENYQLVDNYDPNSRTGKIVLKRLPFASPEQLYTDASMLNEDVYSHIYI